MLFLCMKKPGDKLLHYVYTEYVSNTFGSNTVFLKVGGAPPLGGCS